ncbi:MAG: PAS domain-containing protein [Deltaproteobacteria bacterium]|nr:PAS domain-containing protein [Deltaproteobacteria bacterium]
MKKNADIFSRGTVLNFLVITIMIFMVVSTALFIYISLGLKDRVTESAVRQADIVSNLLVRQTISLMEKGHDNQPLALDEYKDTLGIKNSAIFTTLGKQAFTGKDADGTWGGAVEFRYLKQAVETMKPADSFDYNRMIYKRFIPLLSEGVCLNCHSRETTVLGVVAVELSTREDLETLARTQKFVWALGLLMCLPLGGLVIAGAIIREKNSLYTKLEESNDDLKKTYHELNETKYYLEMILNNSRALIITTNTDGKIVEFNREAQDILEYTKEEVAGKSVLMLYDCPEERAQLAGDERGAGVWVKRNLEVTLRSRSGKPIQVDLTLSTLVDDKERIIGTVGIGKDISEQRMLQFKLLQSEKLAGIGTLASGIAHEINNPLAGILGMAEAIMDEDDTATIKSYTKDIIQYTINASSIVKELSAYSRAASNETTSTVDVSQIMENSLKMSKHAAPFTTVNIVTEFEPDCFIYANAGEMQQVFVNLMVNAIHAMMGRGEGTLKLASSIENGFVKTTISDTGQGIPEKDLSQIFDPFFTTKPAGSGTGLGLYVVYRIVTKYRGTIDVESMVNEGTTFTIQFPSAEGNSKKAVLV